MTTTTSRRRFYHNLQHHSIHANKLLKDRFGYSEEEIIETTFTGHRMVELDEQQRKVSELEEKEFLFFSLPFEFDLSEALKRGGEQAA